MLEKLIVLKATNYQMIIFINVPMDAGNAGLAIVYGGNGVKDENRKGR